MTTQRRWREWLTHHLLDRWLDQRPLLPAPSRARRSPEPGIPHRRRRQAGDRLSGRLRDRRHHGGAVGGDLHRRAVDDRRLAVVQPRRHRDHHSRLSRGRRRRLRGAGERLDGVHRPALRHRIGEQEPVGSRVPLRADAAERERREHRGARRRGRGAQRGRQLAGRRAAPLARHLHSDHAHDDRLADQQLHRAGAADHPVRAEIPRRLDDAGRGHAGGIGLHHRAGRVQLAGRQLSAARRLDRVGPPRVLADGLARQPRARRERRWRRPHRARRHRRTRRCACAICRSRSTTAPTSSRTPRWTIAPGERVLVAGESGTGKSTLVRAIAGLWPWGEGNIEVAERREDVAAAAEGLCADRHACGGPPPIPSRRRARTTEEVAKALEAGRSRPPGRPPRRRGALGPDPVGRREAATGLRAHPSASARHHRARRGHVGARPRRARTS